MAHVTLSELRDRWCSFRHGHFPDHALADARDDNVRLAGLVAEGLRLLTASRTETAAAEARAEVVLMENVGLVATLSHLRAENERLERDVVDMILLRQPTFRFHPSLGDDA